MRRGGLAVDWRPAFAPLAPGPAIGTLWTLWLRVLAWTRKLAGGRG